MKSQFALIVIFCICLIGCASTSTLTFASSKSNQKIDGLYVKEFGVSTNQALIFLHGGPGYNSFSFEASTAELLAQKGFYVIVYDQRGSGRSDSVGLKNYTFENAISDLKTIYEYYKVKKAILLGHSFGGTLAMKYAEKNPEEVKSVILANAPIDQPGIVKSILDNCELRYKQFNNTQGLQALNEIKTYIS